MTAEQRERRVVRVEGVVQGVGFRPFVYALAGRLGLDGLVGNDVDGVFIEVEGPEPRLAQFLSGLRLEAPALASVERVQWAPAPTTGTPGFSIVASAARGTRPAPIPADTATCADCLREVEDPADRRFRYPFTNCTDCGPRFTIVQGVPYDRPLTTMAGFPMCEACAAEYHDPADRRFHAQPTCCPACGPRLRFERDGAGDMGEPIAAAARLLRDGGVLAVKGLGGYHLAVLAADEEATAQLRRRKRREEKPFALMVADLAQARTLCRVDEVGAECLSCRQRPAVLLDRLPEARVASAVAPGNRHLALMLPYTALHHLLLREVGEALVLTSGNVSDEPIAHLDGDAAKRLAGIADAFLVHDRPIQTRTDDSVVRPLFGRPMMVRRSRGYVPDTVTLPVAADRPILACGGELKNTFCLARDRRAVVSHHIGDLENHETLRSYHQGIAHLRRLLDLDPAVIAHDLHPEYLSTKYALELAEGDERLTRVEVQHHHAHIASCLADNGECGPVIGVAFDGLGYGTDGTLWGGEFLLADLRSARRAAHLEPVPMPGGTSAIRQPWRMAAAYLDAAFGDEGAPVELAVLRRNEARWTQVVVLARAGLNAPLTSSAGRLFDAVGALLGLRDEISFEGQAAIALEQIADLDERGAYLLPVAEPAGAEEPLRLRGAELVRAAAVDVLAGVDPGVIAARFHHGVADAIARVCERLSEENGVRTVALSGGVFQNVLLTTGVVRRLEGAGLRVLTHRQVPANDGGISLGQAAVAAAQARGLIPREGHLTCL
ncbi:carbamoyltransferase HypF [Actinospica robiniae]|uniref:carbamoyltransferase HypF n=1 Tax=Actinospica robiniae TaxID=304901 RepID=UPI0005569597|nr:carbamoyltransferase HypF [Actinospica robiniae]